MQQKVASWPVRPSPSWRLDLRCTCRSRWIPARLRWSWWRRSSGRLSHRGALWLSSAVNTRSAVGIALALWAAAWGPHNARLAGWHRVGWAPSVVIGGTALVAPGVGVALGVLGGASAGLFRSRGGPEGLQPIRREAGNRDAQPDIVLVTVDAIRADSGLMHEGQWRADSPFSPTQGWTHFTDAVSAAPWSLPSVHSLLSGMPVNEHGGGLDLGDSFSRRVPDAVPMPYRLQQAGYETRALVSNPFLAIEQGFADGFDRWSHSAEVAEPILLLDVYNRVMSWSTGTQDIDLERNQRPCALRRRCLKPLCAATLCLDSSHPAGTSTEEPWMARRMRSGFNRHGSCSRGSIEHHRGHHGGGGHSR